MGDAELVSLGIVHHVPVEILDVVAFNKSSPQQLRLAPQCCGIGVMKVQVKATPSLSRVGDLLERQLRKPRFGWPQPDEPFMLRCDGHVQQFRPEGRQPGCINGVDHDGRDSGAAALRGRCVFFGIHVASLGVTIH